MTDLLNQKSHFAFGKNWQSFAGLVDDKRIAASDAGIRRLFPGDELRGKSVIDIGCGSGLPALSILRAGADHVTCVDIDPNSVAATRKTLGALAPKTAWTAEVASVFDLTGQYDVVHSWGVLHHTGDMWKAIDKAASLVKPGGLLAISIYGKTLLCGLWLKEKRFYAKAPKAVQKIVLVVYAAVVLAGQTIKGKNPFKTLGSSCERGMDWLHDLHDWLGGYPYESAGPEEIMAAMTANCFERVRENGRCGERFGLVGSVCNEFVYRRRSLVSEAG